MAHILRAHQLCNEGFQVSLAPYPLNLCVASYIAILGTRRADADDRSYLITASQQYGPPQTTATAAATAPQYVK
jgi:predicted trehalose synthase